MREKMNVMVEKKNGKGIGAKRFAVEVLILCLAFSLCACGKKDKYVGTWIGTQGTILVLNKDGSSYYKELDEQETSVGTWELEDEQIIVEECMDYEIYANCGKDAESLLFQADSSRWNDELFVKSK